MEVTSYAGINQGVISSIFTCSIIFTAIFFFIFYGEKLNLRHLVGIFFMTVCVVLISVGSESSTSTTTESTDTTNYLVLAVVLAIFTGLAFAINSLAMRVFITRIHLSPL